MTAVVDAPVSRLRELRPQDVPSVHSLVELVDQRVAGLQVAKQHLAVIVRRHLLAAAMGREFRPPNVVVIGPTGGGKTYLVETMMAAAGAPWAGVAATDFSDTSYSGRPLPTMFTDLWGPRWCLPKVDRVNEAVRIAERFGMIAFDEIDKLHVANRGHGNATVDERRNKSIQAELLKIVEGGMFHVKRTDNDRGWTFDSHGVLMIGMGAFGGLSEQISGDPEDRTSYQRAVATNLMDYGLLEELVGRFSVIITLPPLSIDDLARILDEQVLPVYAQQCADDGLELHADEAGRAHVAAQAYHAHMGARALAAIVDDLLRPAWFDAKPGDRLVLDAGCVQRSSALRVTP